MEREPTIYGVIVGADFDERPDGRIIVRVAVPADTLVAHRQVAIVPSPATDEGEAA